MVAAIQFQIVGLNETLNQLKKLGIEKLNKVNDAVHTAGFELIGEVQLSIAGQSDEPTSVDTGRFLNSVPVDSDLTQPFISKVQSNVPYSKHLEYGTSRIAPRRHFQNSLLRNKDKIEKMIKVSVQ